MSDQRLVHCIKLQKEAQGLSHPPIPGELGKKIHDNICQEAWNAWIQHQTMLINEYRLSMIDPKSRKFLMQELENYFFGTGSDKPPGYTE